MARGASKLEARRLAYRLAKRIAKVTPDSMILRESAAGAWCPSYLIDSNGKKVRVRVIRASNGETAAITEDV